ncbi:hypothetical protein T4B_11667 [Trichinella pseudospiralis]|uniref:Uncharacterized protein n=1 Tax=Trichinella pseudospiralis TaxID=6337 RepID=A0A0V1GHR8_TRIPS|nr:hypothetical protein T4B_11667 [Trichinella pseudospiralis]
MSNQARFSPLIGEKNHPNAENKLEHYMCYAFWKMRHYKLTEKSEEFREKNREPHALSQPMVAMLIKLSFATPWLTRLPHVN